MGLFSKRNRSGKIDYKKALEEKEFKNYQLLRKAQERREALQKVKELEQRQRSANFAQTRTGKFGRFLGRASRFNVNNPYADLSSQQAPIRSGYTRTGRRGRPRGSFDPRYAKYGGVYAYRKLLNASLRERKAQYLRQLAVTPQQQAVLNQIEARNRARQVNPENQVIPDTRGETPIGSFEDEVNAAAGLVP